MDLLGSYNSGSDSEDDNNQTNKKQLPLTNTRGENNNNDNKTDKKKRVIGKKILKLSAVLPEHILNELQKYDGNDKGDEDSDDESYDEHESDNDDSNKKSYHKTVKTSEKTLATAPPMKDYSKDSGLMGLLQELSKSNFSSSSYNKNEQYKVLGAEKNFDTDSIPTEMESEQAIPSPSKAALISTLPTKITSLGDALVTATVETTKRKPRQPTTIRNVHDVDSQKRKGLKKQEEKDFSDEISSTTYFSMSRLSSTSLCTNRQSTLPRPSRIVPAPRGRVAAPLTDLSSASSLSHYSTITYNTDNESNSNLTTATAPTGDRTTKLNENNKNSVKKSKKKLLSRKRQMEQMLRAGRLDEVQGDHELLGVAHVYLNEYSSSVEASSSSIHVVPTGTYDPTTGTTYTSKDVTSQQKNKNQLNSLLANATSLESHRMQNHHFQPMGGTGRGNSDKVSAKRKYGW